MGSAQILPGRDGHEALLDGAVLRLEAPGVHTRIPLAVVREARAEGREVAVELTDGAVHRLDGGNPTAAGAFAAALTAALPAERDPAGSAKVVVSRDKPNEPLPPRFWVLVVVLGLLAVGYLGYLVFAGVTHGPSVILGIIGIVPLGAGLAVLAYALINAKVYTVLALRGITVSAQLARRYRKSASTYEYVDAHEGVHTYSASYRGEQVKVVYDPKQPDDCSRIRSRMVALLAVLAQLLAALVITTVGLSLAALAVVDG